jgi:ADP-ribose pyrophosphatase
MRKVSIKQKRYILDDFFKIEEAYLRFEQFNGKMSPLVRRLNLERGDSVAVLVFNQNTGKLILVSQFRYPTYQNQHGWTIEAIAGMVDPGETPEQTIRRELQEETGMNIDAFEHITTFYPSPGGSSERIYLYYSEVSGEQAKYKKTGGLLGHGEDVKAVEMTMEDTLAKIRSGEIVDAKTIIAIYWLENRLLKKNHP